MNICSLKRKAVTNLDSLLTSRDSAFARLRGGPLAGACGTPLQGGDSTAVIWLVAFLVATPPAGRTRPASSAALIPLGLAGAALSSIILYTRKLAGATVKKQNKKKVEEVLEEEEEE